MPKKFQGENSKAAEAKARKDLVQREQQERKEKDEEDKQWEDNDKHALKKLERKEDKEKKQQEAVQKKLERDKLLEEESGSLKTAKPPPAAKVTKARIDSESERDRIAREKSGVVKAKDKNLVLEDESALMENVNRITDDGTGARSVADAINILSTEESGNLEKHPERRARAAYLAFEERELPKLKEEFSGFRLSQLKQMLKKDWQKSPENPFNQPTGKYNAKAASTSGQDETGD